MRTITQAADELQVSRKKIYNEIKKLNVNTKKDSKSNYIQDKDFITIKYDIQEKPQNNSKCAEERSGTVPERDRNVPERSRNVQWNITDREYTDLKERIFSLEEKIKIKDSQLQAKDHQINGLIQINLNTTKALNLPMDEMATTVIDPDNKKSFWSKFFGK
jgi:hypothetical protein